MHMLYTVLQKKKRELFKLLLSVSGVGASTARTMLSSLAPQHIIQSIASNDVGTIQSIKELAQNSSKGNLRFER